MAAIGSSWAAGTWASIPTPPNPPVTANLVWSLPEDRAAGTQAARDATRQVVPSGVVGIEADVRIVFDAAGDAAEADDLSARTLVAKFRLNSASPVFLTLTEGDGITTVSATVFELAFAAKDANGFVPDLAQVDVYDTASGQETWLARVSIRIVDTAFET